MTTDTRCEADRSRGESCSPATGSFVWASPSIETLPPMAGVEVAFAGRSNVGKSSLINALTGRNALARTSHTPGRTQELIFFDGPDKAGLRLVDMPGYGYASAPKAKVASWTALIHKFLQGRAHAGARLCADRRAAWPEGRRSRRAEDARQGGGELSGRAHQGRSGEGGRTRCPHRRDREPRSPNIPRPFRDVLATSSRTRRRHAGTARRDGAPARGAQPMMPIVSHPDRARRPDGRLRRHAGGGVGASAPTHRGSARPRRCCCSTPLPCSATVALAERGLLHAADRRLRPLAASSSRPRCSPAT